MLLVLIEKESIGYGTLDLIVPFSISWFGKMFETFSILFLPINFLGG